MSLMENEDQLELEKNQSVMNNVFFICDMCVVSTLLKSFFDLKKQIIWFKHGQEALIMT